jgi:hypothetical protein
MADPDPKCLASWYGQAVLRRPVSQRLIITTDSRHFGQYAKMRQSGHSAQRLLPRTNPLASGCELTDKCGVSDTAQ